MYIVNTKDLKRAVQAIGAVSKGKKLFMTITINQTGAVEAGEKGRWYK